ncbi:MAG: di-trans,poly-cis-decaprenylcistransferase, partial [Candidatus Doudnabacteria bacterium]|nr:di-trans,poly-cis-decaprenylcistransferase [Candidatus Doudnabacteria bacterium]
AYFLKHKKNTLNKRGVRLAVLGEVKAFPRNLQKAIHRTVDLLKNNERVKLNIALNYGGRSEIVRAVQNIIREGVEADAVNEELISRHLYTCDSCDPDLIIRTGGELRLSNFLIWQASYAEFYFTDVLWPDFRPEDFRNAIEEFTKRQRRKGK